MGGTTNPSRRSRRVALHIVVALSGLVGPLQAAAAAPLSREAFTEEFVAALKAARPGAEIRVLQPLRLQVVDEKGGVATADLENAFLDYRLDPGALEPLVRRHVAASVSAIPSDPPPTPPSPPLPLAHPR